MQFLFDKISIIVAVISIKIKVLLKKIAAHQLLKGLTI
jgi:hypothetical protein